MIKDVPNLKSDQSLFIIDDVSNGISFPPTKMVATNSKKTWGSSRWNPQAGCCRKRVRAWVGPLVKCHRWWWMSCKRPSGLRLGPLSQQSRGGSLEQGIKMKWSLLLEGELFPGDLINCCWYADSIKSEIPWNTMFGEAGHVTWCV